MKILTYRLIAVGPFTDLALDLSAGNHGLHVILGHNEAGKSSALRAMRALFYGFPAQTTDNFVHEHSALRVGATLRHSDGSELTFIRRKGIRQTLLSADGTPLDDAALSRFLGPVDLQQFTTFFGLGHDELRAGGDQILKGGARIGESLFVAGAGGLRLRKLLENIETRADDLYKKRGRNPRISALLSNYNQVRKEIGDTSLSAEEWSRHDAELSRAVADVAEIQRQIDEKSAGRNRLQRLGRAIPLLARRRAAQESIAMLGPVPALSADFSERRRNAERSLHEAETSIRDTAQQIVRLDEELASLEIPQDLLEQGESIEALYGQLRSYQESLEQVPALTRTREQARLDAERILRDVRPDVPLEQTEALRLSTARREELHSHSRQSEALKQTLHLARKTLADLEEEKRQTEAELSERPAPPEPAALQSILATARERGPLEKQWNDGSIALRRAIRNAEADLKKLGLWAGTLESLETLAVPAAESIERARAEQDKLNAGRERAAEAVRRLETELADVAHQLDVLRAGGEIPSESDLKTAREHRDLGWTFIRKTLLGAASDADGVAGFSGDAKLEDAYERAVARADAIADVLRAEADRVAQQAALLSQRKLLDERLNREKQRHADTDSAIAMALQAWKSLWAQSGIDPLSPAEMAAWSARQRDLAQAARRIREETETLAELEKEIASLRDRVGAALNQVAKAQFEGSAPRTESRRSVRSADPANERAPVDLSLSVALAQAEKTLEQIRANAEQRAALTSHIRKLTLKIDKARENASVAERELAAWSQRWTKSIESLGIATDAEPAVALAVLRRIDELLLKIESARATETEIARHQARIESFEAQAKKLAASLAPDSSGATAQQIAASLYARLKKSREDSTRREGLATRRRHACETLEKARRKQQSARDEQAALLQLAGCEAIDQIPSVEEKHAAWLRGTIELEQAHRELLLLTAGETIDELAAQASALNPDALPAQLEEAAKELGQLNAARTEGDRKIGQEREILSRMDGNARASEAAERAQELLADLRQSTEEYARLTLAGKILHRGIERYRQRKQGPLLGRASDLFAQLTLGSFTALQAAYDDNDEPMLVGVRGSSQIKVADMSDGTRDQLYLALRLATLEDYLRHGEPIPFVVDDILIHFDDARAAATLRILAELSKKTQVILFTHHAHLAHLAADVGECVFQTMLSRAEPPDDARQSLVGTEARS